MTSPLHVVGIDLSLTATGIAHIVTDPVTGPTVELRRHGRDGLSTITDPGRRAVALHTLAAELGEYARSGGSAVDLALIETPALSRSRGGVFERGYVWHELARQLHTAGIPTVGVDPGQLKLYATGKGSAGKGEVVDAVARRWPMFATRGDNNLADAAVLAAIGADLLGAPLCPMPATHRRALDKLTAPEAIGA